MRDDPAYCQSVDEEVSSLKFIQAMLVACSLWNTVVALLFMTRNWRWRPFMTRPPLQAGNQAMAIFLLVFNLAALGFFSVALAGPGRENELCDISSIIVFLIYVLPYSAGWWVRLLLHLPESRGYWKLLALTEPEMGWRPAHVPTSVLSARCSVPPGTARGVVRGQLPPHRRTLAEVLTAVPDGTSVGIP